MNFFLAIIATIVCYPAVAQVQYGTVGVVHFTQEKISVAADSRVTIKGRTPGQDDTACKVLTLGGNLIFLSAGAGGYQSHNFMVPSWMNTEEARRAYDQVPSGSVREIAREW